MKNTLYCLIILLISIISANAQENSHFNLFSTEGDWGQSVANYGKYIISVKDRLSSALLYDLEENKRVYRLFLTPHEERNGSTLIYHCNQCNFGSEKYDEQDMFPLLYINQRNPADSIGALITAYRIVPKLDENDSIVSFSMDLIQSIYLPLMTDENCLGNPNMVIDTKKNVFYTYSRNNNRKASNYGKGMISKFKMPSLYKDGSIQEVVRLTDDDILDSFKCDFNMFYAQGGFFRKGKLYFVQGMPSKTPSNNYIYFREINLKKKKQTRVVDMLALGFDKEPEGCWFYNGKVMISVVGKEFYELTREMFKVK